MAFFFFVVSFFHGSFLVCVLLLLCLFLAFEALNVPSFADHVLLMLRELINKKNKPACHSDNTTNNKLSNIKKNNPYN